MSVITFAAIALRLGLHSLPSELCGQFHITCLYKIRFEGWQALHMCLHWYRDFEIVGKASSC